jgi:hypothetical protein
LAGCPVFPADHVWNTRVDQLPVHPRSAAYLAAIGRDAGLWIDPSMPYEIVGVDQPPVPIHFTRGAGDCERSWPVPRHARVEGGSDHHVLVVDSEARRLYEIFDAVKNADDSWTGYFGGEWELPTHALTPDGMPTADAAGLPILAGLLRYEEVAAGLISHALRFTAPRTQRAHVWPARAHASSITDPDVPPMGQRFRLRADFDLSGFSPRNRVVLQALKSYGLMLADNGGAWVITGANDGPWSQAELDALHVIKGHDFEAVDVSSLMVDPNSGQVR